MALFVHLQKKLGDKKAASLLHESLEDEKEADVTLSKIAESIEIETVESYDNAYLMDSTRESRTTKADFL